MARQEKLSTEEAGRKVRYEAFEEVLEGLKKAEGGKIAVAHHRMDSAETLLFNLFRGTGIRGLAGIRPVRGRIIRPLLDVERDQIEEYLEEKGVAWCIDSTNEEDTYSRNRIRNNLLPYVERELVVSAVKHVARTGLEITGLVDFLEAETEKAAAGCCEIFPEGETTGQTEAVKLYLPSWRKLHPYLQEQLLLWALDRMRRGRKDITSIHLKGLMELSTKNGSKRMDLPGNLEAVKEYHNLWIRPKNREEEEKKKEIQLSVPGSISFGEGWKLQLSVIDLEKVGRIEENQYTKYLDYDRINNCLSLRYREKGDFLVINDQGQKKLLKEYLIQEKIPVSLRGSLPLIADGKHILWVIGHRISAYYKVTGDTKRCLQMKIWREQTWEKEYV